MTPKKNNPKILKVKKGSVAEKYKVHEGDIIIAFDGHLYVDELDYIFYNNQAKFLLKLEEPEGNIKEILIEKAQDEDLGIMLEEVELAVKPCTNKCIFCFVDQCKKGMRKTLYVKDDDYRLSFISGNYITLTNVRDEEINRIIRLGLSPLYISVHCISSQLRKKLCTNEQSADLFDKIDKLVEGGIALHTQIVLIEGLNDKKELINTMQALFERTNIKSLAVVPVGLTKYRKELYPLKTISKECAIQTIKDVEKFNSRASKSRKRGFVWCSDEMYLLAEKPIPGYSYYKDFPQIENGVGLISEFLYELSEELAETPYLKGGYTLITGESFGSLLKNIANALKEVYDVNLDVKVIKNEFFGDSITVAGLITGGDIVNQLKDNLVYKDIIIPHTMLKEFETVFLDDVSVLDVEDKLNCKIHVARGGEGLIKVLRGKK